MHNAPERIYLQIDPDGTDPTEEFLIDGATWCQDKINETDVEYARADEIDRLRTEVAELRQDADRLELLASRGASIVKCRDGYYLYWHTSNRAGPTMPTARSAIDAALAKDSSHE